MIEFTAPPCGLERQPDHRCAACAARHDDAVADVADTSQLMAYNDIVGMTQPDGPEQRLVVVNAAEFDAAFDAAGTVEKIERIFFHTQALAEHRHF